MRVFVLFLYLGFAWGAPLSPQCLDALEARVAEFKVGHHISFTHIPKRWVGVFQPPRRFYQGHITLLGDKTLILGKPLIHVQLDKTDRRFRLDEIDPVSVQVRPPVAPHLSMEQQALFNYFNRAKEKNLTIDIKAPPGKGVLHSYFSVNVSHISLSEDERTYIIHVCRDFSDLQIFEQVRMDSLTLDRI